jgi:hypothetical protein
LNDRSGGDGVEARDVRITQFDDWFDGSFH